MAVQLKRKICFVFSSQSTVEAFMLKHLLALQSFFDVTLIVNTNQTNFLEKYNIHAKVISVPICRKINILSDIGTLATLIFIFSKSRYSSVHSVTPKAGLLAMLASILTRVPLRVHTFTGQVWASKSGVKRLLLKQIDKFIYAMTTHQIIDSPSQRLFLISEGVLKTEDSIVFGKGSISGVDVERFKFSRSVRESLRRHLGIKKNGTLFLFLGRLNRDKGVLDLAKAFDLLSSENAFLLFVGPDEGGMRSRVMEIVTHYSDRVFFVGETAVPESFMTAADVICLPSYREGFGTVIIEAAAVGIPAIASSIYGITDAVVENFSGLLHPPGDVSCIRACMEELLVDKKKRKILGRQAKDRVIKDFNGTLITDAWLDFYKRNLLC